MIETIQMLPEDITIPAAIVKNPDTEPWLWLTNNPVTKAVRRVKGTPICQSYYTFAQCVDGSKNDIYILYEEAMDFLIEYWHGSTTSPIAFRMEMQTTENFRRLLNMSDDLVRRKYEEAKGRFASHD